MAAVSLQGGSRMNMKRYGPLLLLLAVTALLIIPQIGKTLSYYSDTETKVNHAVMGFNEIEIEEEFEEPDEIKPGAVIDKTVRVKNTGNGDCYVRIKAVFSHSLTGDKCTVDWNTKDFTYKAEDGYWYYNHILPTGESTSALMTKVTVGADIPTGAEDLPEIKLIVYAESVQSKRFANADEAWAFFNEEK